MSNTPKFSLIIPVFNCSKLLPRCLDSILIQTYTDYEVILINDGSTDNTSEICSEYVQRDIKIKYFQQENSGVSKARNLGIINSSGTFLFFVDADDFLYDSQVLLNINRYISKHIDCDIFQFQTFIRNKLNIQPLKLICTDVVIDIRKYANLKIARGEVWNYIFRKDIILSNKVLFIDNLRVSEDQAFVYSYFVYCQKIGISSIPTYYYCDDNSQSATKRNYSQQDLDDHICAISYIISHLNKKRNSYYFICERIAMMFIHILNIYLQITSYNLNDLKKKIHIEYRYMKNNKCLLLFLMKCNLKFSLFLYKKFIFNR